MSHANRTLTLAPMAFSFCNYRRPSCHSGVCALVSSWVLLCTLCETRVCLRLPLCSGVNSHLALWSSLCRGHNRIHDIPRCPWHQRSSCRLEWTWGLGRAFEWVHRPAAYLHGRFSLRHPAPGHHPRLFEAEGLSIEATALGVLGPIFERTDASFLSSQRTLSLRVPGRQKCLRT
ncbi:hypothetical protein B0H15DRAFT_562585 [Mycena belliarum]|uniref:Uncharacterized protein n=1 Tax=Mycena belliarum TaxID=1033014 RepID=A0AAD6XKY7_9AGAR|nr:hypothetical protein B0H15DRAFT_562585 [Mycena belliae]